MIKVAFGLVYIHLRKLFAKGDYLTIGVLIAGLLFVVSAIYQRYESFYLLPFVFLFSTISHHLMRDDFSLLKIRKDFRKIIFIEYFLYNFLFLGVFLVKKDWFFAFIYLLSLILVVFIPQKTMKIKYPFDLFDPFWHISFRKYKIILIIFFAIILIIFFAIMLIVIAKNYENPNLALFAFFVVSVISTLPYFEREFPLHIVISSYLGQRYLLEQIKVGSINFAIVFVPVLMMYFICFRLENFWILFLFSTFPLLGILTKYAFFDNKIVQNLSFVLILGGIFYGIPLLAIPFLYHKSVQKIKRIQYANH